MSTTVILAVTAISLALGIFLWLLVAGSDPVRRRALANLQRGLGTGTASESAQDAAVENVRAREARGLASRLTPTPVMRTLERLHAKAGRPGSWPLERLLALKIVLAVSFALLGFLFVRAVPRPLTVVLAIGVTVVAYVVPELLLYSRAQERKEKIQLELADTLDQMTIAVEAGLGFESAMAQVARNGRGPLAEELVRTLQDMQVGQTRRQAYEGLARRTDVRDLRRFISAVIQADAYGIAIADVLRTQASEMRLKRRQRAEEKAMQIPVKVIFPLMICILPVLFIVLLGPAAIDMMDAFG